MTIADRELGDAKELQDARRDVGEFQNAESLFDGGRLEADQSTEARAVEVFYIAEVDHDLAAFGEKRLDHFPELVCCFAYEFAVALHRFEFVPKLIIP